MPIPYLAFSYHFATDYEFVCTLADALVQRGVPAWYLDELSKPEGITTEQRLGGLFDWRKEPQNWHATYLDHLCEASGIIVVLSESAKDSQNSVGRGMWRERAAIDYFLADNPMRVREVTRDAETPSEELISELATWGKAVLTLPPVLRKVVDNPNVLNEPTGLSGMLQLPELKTRATVWYELVRLDLYDVQWHCRRCGLQSDPYIMSEQSPPSRCPRCGFENLSLSSATPDDEAAPLPDQDKQSLGKIAAAFEELRERFRKQPENSTE